MLHHLKLFFTLLILFATFSHAKTMTDFNTSKEACEVKEDAVACVRMFYFYIPTRHTFIKGLEVNIKKALYYAKKACNLGDEDGCFSVGMLIYYGDDRNNIVANKKEGRKFFKKACDLGKEDSCALFLNKSF